MAYLLVSVINNPCSTFLVPVCFCAKQEQLRWLTEHHAAPCMSFWAEGMRQSFPEAQTAGCRMSCAAILEVAEACLARRSRHTGGGTHSLLQLAVLMLTWACCVAEERALAHNFVHL